MRIAVSLLFVNLVGSGPDLMPAVILVGPVLLAFWAFTGDRSGLARIVESVLILAATVGLIAVLGEVVLRLPRVVAKTGWTTTARAEQRESYDDLWQSNALGLRSFHVESTKPEGVFRIVVLGDSFTWGDQIPRSEDLWPNVLENVLTSRGSRVQAVNLAQRGYTTVNEAESLDLIGWQFEPDLVILQFTLNDPLPSGPGFVHEPEEWLFRTRNLVPLPAVHEKLDRSSYFYAYLNSLFVRSQLRLFYSEGYSPLYSDGFDGWIACQAAIGEIAATSREKGVPFMMVVFPSLSTATLERDSYPFLELHHKIRLTAEESGVPVLDLRPVFEAVEPRSEHWRALPRDGHPGEEAHRLAAQSVAEEMNRLGLPPKLPATADSGAE